MWRQPEQADRLVAAVVGDCWLEGGDPTLRDRPGPRTARRESTSGLLPSGPPAPNRPLGGDAPSSHTSSQKEATTILRQGGNGPLHTGAVRHAPPRRRSRWASHPAPRPPDSAANPLARCPLRG
jgi:hypothetical protein